MATASGRDASGGALGLIDRAATTCLERANERAARLDLLINAGLYKNANTAEPALATLVQEDIGANPEPKILSGHGTFAFDVLNGGAGVVTAAKLLDTFVSRGTAQYGMIVAGDVDPSPRTSHHYPFLPASGALLVRHVTGDTGFRAFEIRTFPELAHLFEVTVHWEPGAGWLRRGRNIVDVHEDPAYAQRAIELAVDVTSAFLAKHGLRADDIDLLITSQYPRASAVELPRRLGISWLRVPRVAAGLGYAHTAGPLAALEAAFLSGQFGAAHRTLFVTVGAGITVGVALYEAAASA